MRVKVCMRVCVCVSQSVYESVCMSESVYECVCESESVCV